MMDANVSYQCISCLISIHVFMEMYMQRYLYMYIHTYTIYIYHIRCIHIASTSVSTFMHLFTSTYIQVSVNSYTPSHTHTYIWYTNTYIYACAYAYKYTKCRYTYIHVTHTHLKYLKDGIGTSLLAKTLPKLEFVWHSTESWWFDVISALLEKQFREQHAAPELTTTLPSTCASPAQAAWQRFLWMGPKLPAQAFVKHSLV